MFAGGRRRSSNIRAMQLFHELKQQFPTVPDRIVTSCITNAISSPQTTEENIIEVLETTIKQNNQQELMGLQTELSADSVRDGRNEAHELTGKENKTPSEGVDQSRPQVDMNENDVYQNIPKPNVVYTRKDDCVNVNHSSPDIAHQIGNSSFYLQRPTHLDINPQSDQKPTRKEAYQRIQPSERCKDVHKLLNSDILLDKPPRSPVSAKRIPSAKNSPVKTEEVPSVKKSETAEKPTQTTDTLVSSGSVNLSLNVNCSMDVVQSPTRPLRRSSVLQLTPEQPWLQEPVSPRSYTSVNLTLRPPSSEPQAPIDITSQNSSLTYSTSTFDSQKGLQSKLQITVGPGGGSVSSVRTRPRSSYHPEGEDPQMVPARSGSLVDLANEPPVEIKQQARIDRLRIELNTEKARLVIMKKEVAELENNQNIATTQKIDEELEKQLVREIQHLNCQCERLETEVSQLNEGLYNNIRSSQNRSLPLDFSALQIQRGRLQYEGPLPQLQPDVDGPKWNCHLCTFQNHPALNKCEQCEMPRILHGTNSPHPPNVPNNSPVSLRGSPSSYPNLNAPGFSNSNLPQYQRGGFYNLYGVPRQNLNMGSGGNQLRQGTPRSLSQT